MQRTIKEQITNIRYFTSYEVTVFFEKLGGLTTEKGEPCMGSPPVV